MWGRPLGRPLCFGAIIPRSGAHRGHKPTGCPPLSGRPTAPGEGPRQHHDPLVGRSGGASCSTTTYSPCGSSFGLASICRISLSLGLCLTTRSWLVRLDDRALDQRSTRRWRRHLYNAWTFEDVADNHGKAFGILWVDRSAAP